jgi:hypothetical protein
MSDWLGRLHHGLQQKGGCVFQPFFQVISLAKAATNQQQLSSYENWRFRFQDDQAPNRLWLYGVLHSILRGRNGVIN